MNPLTDYEILQELYRFGMLTAYKGRDRNTGQFVILKSVPLDLVGIDAQARRRQLEALTRLDHPNILRLLKVVEEAGQLYAVYEYVEGRRLGVELRSRSMSPLEAATIVRSVALAVHSAHEAGIIHRDLKPAYVLLGNDGQPRVEEFMLPAEIDEARRVTATGAIQGTPAYMAPEQVQCDAGQLGPASDVYGLGAILYEALTGQPPNAGSTPMEILSRVMTHDPTPPRAVNPAVPEELEAVCLKCLARSPEQRYPSAKAVADELSRIIGGEDEAVVRGTYAAAKQPRTRGLSPARAPSPPAKAESAPRPQLAPKPQPPAPARRAGDPELPGVTTDAVVFTVTSPPVLAPGNAGVIDVWAHLEKHRQEVLDRARSEAGGDVSAKSKGSVEIARGSVLTVKLAVQDLLIDDPEDTILWRGEIGNATFAVRVPPSASPGGRQGVASIHIGGLRVARVAFVVEIGAARKEPELLPTREERHRKAFASYATPDRDEVLARVQGIQKGAPGLDVFLDVVQLRSGQHWEGELFQRIADSDIFYLFWSDNARQSTWVEKEWRHALTTRGLDFIDPVPLAAPDEVPPPKELAEKHFNDWVLAFRRNRRKETFLGGLMRKLGLR